MLRWFKYSFQKCSCRLRFGVNVTQQIQNFSKHQASHVEQIFDSPEVSITYDNQNLNNQQERTPVIVTNNSFVRNTNTKGQKLFQYTFDFELSNNPTGR